MMFTRSCRKRLAKFSAFLAIFPVFLCLIFSRDSGGSVSVFSLRRTNLRVYHGDSGNLAIAVRTSKDLWRVPAFGITREHYVPWLLANYLCFYLECPYFICDLCHRGES